MRYLCLCLFLINALMGLNAEVWVYNYPDTIIDAGPALGMNFRSHIYDVKVVQDTSGFDSYVLADFNTVDYGARDMMTEWNHSTCFSFTGSVNVEVMRRDSADLGEVKIYPLHWSIPHSVENGKKLVIQLSRPRKLYIEMEGMDEHPLFIFADTAETFTPGPDSSAVLKITPGLAAATVKSMINSTSKSIVYFMPGVHTYGPQTNDTYDGFKLPMLDGETYYLPGGAYLKASLYGTDLQNTSVRGRGIISLCGILGKSGEFTHHSIFFDNGGSNHLVEGITVTNPVHYCILSRADLDCRNVKLFGWWYSTDGFGGNHGSVIDDAFMKVNDDFVKVYRDNQVATNIVLFKQINGAAFQLGWNAYGAATNGRVSNVYIVKDAPKVPGTTSNTAVINLKNNEGSGISNLLFEHIYMENDVQRTLGIDVYGGSIQNIHLRDIYLDGQNNASNYIYGPLGVNTL